MSEDLAGCPGKYMPLRGYNAAICLGCARYGVRSANPIEPVAAPGPDRVWHCENKPRPAHSLTPEQVAAVDETAGLR
jgi:hypothetical protein